jgi:hypothetical protein
MVVYFIAKTIEEFDGQNFCRWQERVHSILDMYSDANALN